MRKSFRGDVCKIGVPVARFAEVSKGMPGSGANHDHVHFCRHVCALQRLWHCETGSNASRHLIQLHALPVAHVAEAKGAMAAKPQLGGIGEDLVQSLLGSRVQSLCGGGTGFKAALQ